MTPLMTPSPAAPFAAPDAGFDYLATEAHYLSLAGRIVAALRRGSSFVVVTGDPPPASVILSRVLDSAAAWWYRAVCVAGASEVSREQLLPAAPSPPETGAGKSADGDEPLLSRAPVFVFDEVDRLSNDQIENICQTLARSDGGARGVLLARPGFFTRLEGSPPSWLRSGLTAQLCADELGREEIATFISRQLISTRRENAFTAETITAIANAAGGDPALVNYLSRVMLTFAEAVQREKSGKEGAADVLLANSPVPKPASTGGGWSLATHAAGPTSPEPIDPLDRLAFTPAVAEPPPRALTRRRSAVWRRGVGVLSCLAIAGGLLLVPRAKIDSLMEAAEQKIAAVTAPGLSDRITAWFYAASGRPSAGPPKLADRASSPAAIATGRAERLDAAPAQSGSAARSATHATRASPPGVATASASTATDGPANRSKASAALATPDGAKLLATVVSGAWPASATSPAGASEQAGQPIPPSITPQKLARAPATGPAPVKVSLAPVSLAAPPRAPAAAPSRAPAAAIPGDPPAAPHLSAKEIAALVARGDDFVGLGDLASARLFFARAAEAGDGRAALRMAASFDPAFLDRAGIHGEPAGPQQAVSWYRRARALGEAEAMQQLKRSAPPPP